MGIATRSNSQLRRVSYSNDRSREAHQAGSGRGGVKTKTDLAVNQICKIQTSKSRRFESRLGLFARFSKFAKAPGVFTLASAKSGQWLYQNDCDEADARGLR